MCPRACAPHKEKSLQREAHTLQLESSPCSPQLEKSPRSNKNSAFNCGSSTRAFSGSSAGKKSAYNAGVQFTQSCPTLRDPVDCSTPGLPVRHQLPGSTRTRIEWCHPSISCSVIPFFSHLQPFPASGSFPMSQFFASGGQSIGVSASASVLPMNVQDWFPLKWTGWISLQSKGLSRVFSNTTVQKNQFFGAQLYSPTLTSIHDYQKNHSFD